MPVSAVEEPEAVKEDWPRTVEALMPLVIVLTLKMRMRLFALSVTNRRFPLAVVEQTGRLVQTSPLEVYKAVYKSKVTEFVRKLGVGVVFIS